jgi:hypothetical protein
MVAPCPDPESDLGVLASPLLVNPRDAGNTDRNAQ